MGASSVIVCGTINWDTLLFVDQLPLPGEEIKVDRIISVPGGKGANTAVSAARILGRGKVTLLAGLGADAVGYRQIKALQREGVVTTAILRKRHSKSGCAFVAIDSEGEDMILTHVGANDQLDSDLLSKSSRAIKAVKEADSFVITDPPLSAAMWLAKQAKREGGLLTLSPAMLTLQGFDALEKYLLLADYVILNQQEAAVLLGSHAPTPTNDHSAAALSKRLDGKKVIVTLGSRGCVLFSEAASVTVPTLDLSSLGLKVISSAGAGDAFVGAFAAYKTVGMDDVGAIIRANFAAALKTTQAVVRGSPRRREIERYVREHGVSPAGKIRL